MIFVVMVKVIEELWTWLKEKKTEITSNAFYIIHNSIAHDCGQCFKLNHKASL